MMSNQLAVILVVTIAALRKGLRLYLVCLPAGIVTTYFVSSWALAHIFRGLKPNY
jgi:hypothetical protein